MSKTVFKKYDGSVLTADLTNIKEVIGQLELYDFNYLLTKIIRHNGAFGDICSVYAHSSYMAEKVEMVYGEGDSLPFYKVVENACLVHDFAEVFTGDIPKPAKDQFCYGSAGNRLNNIREFEELVTTLALEKYFNQEEYPADFVSRLDRMSVYAEALVFGGIELFKGYLEADEVDITSPEGSLFLMDIIEYSQGMKESYEYSSTF